MTNGQRVVLLAFVLLGLVVMALGLVRNTQDNAPIVASTQMTPQATEAVVEPSPTTEPTAEPAPTEAPAPTNTSEPTATVQLALAPTNTPELTPTAKPTDVPPAPTARVINVVQTPTPQPVALAPTTAPAPAPVNPAPAAPLPTTAPSNPAPAATVIPAASAQVDIAWVLSQVAAPRPVTRVEDGKELMAGFDRNEFGGDDSDCTRNIPNSSPDMIHIGEVVGSEHEDCKIVIEWSLKYRDQTILAGTYALEPNEEAIGQPGEWFYIPFAVDGYNDATRIVGTAHYMPQDWNAHEYAFLLGRDRDDRDGTVSVVGLSPTDPWVIQTGEFIFANYPQ